MWVEIDLMPVEVGVLGLVADSMHVSFKAVGVWSKELHTALSEMALRCSYLIFLQHKTQVWTSWWMFKVPKLLNEDDWNDPLVVITLMK